MRFIASGIIIGMSLAFLWHFSNIWRLGVHTVGEQSLPALIFETALILAILVFGIKGFVTILRKK